jgi:hypothetical protein
MMNIIRDFQMIVDIAGWHSGVILDNMQHQFQAFLLTRTIKSPSNSSG